MDIEASVNLSSHQRDYCHKLIGHSLYAMIKQKPDKKSGVKRSEKANMRMLRNLYT